ncbi:MAG: hypothetical protein KAJ07_04710 [Planctomycetes bacterium]|nr:hypothetical protein [Planctomycetota bacterium]
MKKHIKYLGYVLRHKWFVLVAGIKIGSPLLGLIVHDWHKFKSAEWFPYVNYFYGGIDMQSPPEQIQKKFDAAWLHHQHLGRHHWQHWILREDSGNISTLDMPRKYALEMVADWMGAGRAITGVWEMESWFLSNHQNMEISKKTWGILKGIFAGLAMVQAHAVAFEYWYEDRNNETN